MTAMSVAEATDWGVFSKPLKLPFKLLGERYAKGLVCYGGALAGQLLKALLDRGIEPRLEHPARELVVEDGRVVGRPRRSTRGRRSSSARGAASSSRRGGFEWNRELAAQFLGGVLTHPNSPPTQRGRRPAHGDVRRRGSREHERGVVVPVARHPRRGVRRQAAPPRGLRHALDAAHDHREPEGHAASSTRRRTTTTS